MSLPPELERFAEEAIAAGRYRNPSHMVTADIDLVRRADAERAAVIRSLEAAQREAEHTGWHELDDVLAEIDTIIAKEARARA